MTPNISLSKGGPGIKRFQSALAKIAKSEVLVGIPQSRNSRKGEKIGNAALMYILANGSPGHKIPARPVIEPAIAADGNRQAIASDLQDAVKGMLNDNPTQATTALRRAGMAGSNAAKAWFTDPRNNWPPNRPSTIRRKKSDRPLIDTGDLRRSITYVVRESR